MTPLSPDPVDAPLARLTAARQQKAAADEIDIERKAELARCQASAADYGQRLEAANAAITANDDIATARDLAAARDLH